MAINPPECFRFIEMCCTFPQLHPVSLIFLFVFSNVQIKFKNTVNSVVYGDFGGLHYLAPFQQESMLYLLYIYIYVYIHTHSLV